MILIDTLYGRYSKSGDLELQGSPDSIIQLADLLVSEHQEIDLSTPNAIQSAPYDAFITAIHLKRQEGHVVIQRTDTVLTICGSLENLALLADNLKWLANQVTVTGCDNHLHIEYYPDHFYLNASSVPLVVSVETNLK